MLLIGYCCGSRSERRLCAEVHLHLAYRRFCRLGLDGAVPDHATFSKNRHGRFRDSNLLRQVFEATVRRCMAEGIVGGQGFVVDASMIRADANRQKGVARREELNTADASRAVDEYLAVLDDTAFGAATEVPPKFVSPTDPAARWTAAAAGPACYAYCDNYLIDAEHAVIVDVEATTAVRQDEVGAAQTMLTRTAETFDLWPERLIADTGYGSAAMLGWLAHEQGIEPHIRCSTSRSARMAPSAAPTSSMTASATSISARPARSCCTTGASSRGPGTASMPTASCGIAPPSTTAASAR